MNRATITSKGDDCRVTVFLDDIHTVTQQERKRDERPHEVSITTIRDGLMLTHTLIFENADDATRVHDCVREAMGVSETQVADLKTEIARKLVDKCDPTSFSGAFITSIAERRIS